MLEWAYSTKNQNQQINPKKWIKVRYHLSENKLPNLTEAKTIHYCPTNDVASGYFVRTYYYNNDTELHALVYSLV